MMSIFAAITWVGRLRPAKDNGTGRTGWRLMPWLVLLPFFACAGFDRPANKHSQIHPAQILSVEGLGPVRIGMTIEQAERALEAPLRPRERSASPACWITGRADGREPDIAYMVVHGHIRRIDLLSGRLAASAVRSEQGIGIGATEEAALRAYGSRLIVAPHKYTGADGGHYLVLIMPGGRSGMIFETFNGQVTQVRAGFRPELDYVEGCS